MRQNRKYFKGICKLLIRFILPCKIPETSVSHLFAKGIFLFFIFLNLTDKTGLCAATSQVVVTDK